MAKKDPTTTLLGELKKFYRVHGRGHLPWRRTRDPYRILVSEMMLQQTQVERVVPYYERWVRTYPTAQKLARATLPEVLRLWQGLGYNRRAKYLHEAAKVISASEAKSLVGGSRGRVYLSRRQELFAQRLPGVGPYTRGAVLAFALNKPEVFVETNIRTVLFHSDILKNVRMSDAQLLPIVEQLLKKSKMEPRDFYAAMMDYGAHLKRQGVKLNSRSKHYAKQSTFEGSARQLRGAIMRQLLKAPATHMQLTKNLSRKRGEVERELSRLVQEGLVEKVGRGFSIATS